jgi:hypothetical protein
MRRSALFSVVASMALLNSPAAAQDGDGASSVKEAPATTSPAAPPAAPPAPSKLPELPDRPPNAWTPGNENETAAETLPPPPPPATAITDPRVIEVHNDGGPPDPGPTHMNSPAMFMVGLGLGGSGFVAFFTGLGFRFAATPCSDCSLTSQQEVGIGLMIAGGVSFGVGVALVSVGARQVHNKPAWARAMPTVGVGPHAASLRWEF